jgi:hypothetical protein
MIKPTAGNPTIDPGSGALPKMGPKAHKAHEGHKAHIANLKSVKRPKTSASSAPMPIIGPEHHRALEVLLSRGGDGCIPQNLELAGLFEDLVAIGLAERQESDTHSVWLAKRPASYGPKASKGDTPSWFAIAEAIGRKIARRVFVTRKCRVEVHLSEHELTILLSFAAETAFREALQRL